MLQFLIKFEKKAIFYFLNTLYIHKRYLKIREADMTLDEKRRFTVITNNSVNTEEVEHNRIYQTNPLKERFVKFANEEAGRKFSVEDLLRW